MLRRVLAGLGLAAMMVLGQGYWIHGVGRPPHLQHHDGQLPDVSPDAPLLRPGLQRHRRHDRWIVIFDRYRERRMGAARSEDLRTWEDVSAQVVFPEGTRHGTAVEIPRDLLRKLQAAR